MTIIEVLVDLGSTNLDVGYYYDASNFSVVVGARVKVPLGPRQVVGIVSLIYDKSKSQEIINNTQYEIKEILALIDTEPIINAEQFALAKYLAYQTVAPIISCLSSMVPRLLSTQKLVIPTVAYYQVQRKELQLPPRQKEAYQYLLNQKKVLRKDFNRLFPGMAAPLLKKELIELILEKESPLQIKLDAEIPPTLTLDQKNALREIKAHQNKPILLHGVTGSGKTELYLNLAAEVIKDQKQALILVPEISLTPQMIERFQKRFANQVAIYHSRLTITQRIHQYQLVKENQVQIVVGTRSAVFLPFDKLGLIVMDEEHDYSYKQAETPRYHCRDVVLYRGKRHQALVVLGSATPAFESYARALKDVYHLVKLPNRINQEKLSCQIVDTKKALKAGQSHILTNQLLEAIALRLQAKQQTLLFLNRRGHTPVLKCNHCQEVLMCDDCDVSLTYHQDNKLLICHICGKTKQLPQICPYCQTGSFSYYGFGTQKVVEELNKHFPQAKVVRMDLDSVAAAGSHQKVLDKFHKSGDILIGTQMIAKGLDYPNITLVGILNGDAYLIKDDFRSIETTYALLVQASGRSGRGDTPGEVLIQAYNQDHYALKLACQGDYDRFFRYEMQFRHLALYPPYSYLTSLTLLSKNENQLDLAADQIKTSLSASQFQILGPSQLIRQRNHYRKRITIKSKNLDEMLEVIHQHFASWQNIKSVKVIVDVNPLVWG